MSAKVLATRTGFTLVELLIVIAIISLLASFVVPVMRFAFEFANTGVCGNNLSQIHRGMMVYEMDHRGQPRWLAHNFHHYAWNNTVYFWGQAVRKSLCGGYRPPSGYSGLGNLVGSNDPLTLQNATSDWFSLPSLRPHFKYVSEPQIFYCPQQGDKSLKWRENGLDWDRWPFDNPKSSNNTHNMCYSMRPGTLSNYNIQDDQGFIVNDAGSSSYYMWKAMAHHSMLVPESSHRFGGSAVAADANGSKYYSYTGHRSGCNVVYRDGSVHWFEDGDGLLSTNNTVVQNQESGPGSAAMQVSIWNAYDQRNNP